MDRVDDFSWLLSDIDCTLVFMLRDGKEMLGSYIVKELVVNGKNHVNIKFANINDLDSFINYGMIRFCDSINDKNVVDIPIRKLYDLYNESSLIEEGAPKGLKLEKLDTFAVRDGKVLSGGYAIYGYKICECSEELNTIIKIGRTYSELSMNDKIDALEEINLLSYKRNNQKKGKKL